MKRFEISFKRLKTSCLSLTWDARIETVFPDLGSWAGLLGWAWGLDYGVELGSGFGLEREGERNGKVEKGDEARGRSWKKKIRGEAIWA